MPETNYVIKLNCTPEKTDNNIHSISVLLYLPNFTQYPDFIANENYTLAQILIYNKSTKIYKISSLTTKTRKTIYNYNLTNLTKEFRIYECL